MNTKENQVRFVLAKATGSSSGLNNTGEEFAKAVQQIIIDELQQNGVTLKHEYAWRKQTTMRYYGDLTIFYDTFVRKFTDTDTGLSVYVEAGRGEAEKGTITSPSPAPYYLCFEVWVSHTYFLSKEDVTSVRVTEKTEFDENAIPTITEEEVRNAARKMLTVLNTGRRLKQIIGAEKAREFVVETLRRKGITYLSPAGEYIRDALSTIREDGVSKIRRTISVNLAFTTPKEKFYGVTYSIVLKLEANIWNGKVALRILAGADASTAKEIFYTDNVKDAGDVEDAIDAALSLKEFHNRLRSSLQGQLKREKKEEEYYRWVVGEAHPRKVGKELQLSLPKLLQAAAENFAKKLISKLIPEVEVKDVRLEINQERNLHTAEIFAWLEGLVPAGKPGRFLTVAIHGFRLGTATVEVTVGKDAIFIKSFSYSISKPNISKILTERDTDYLTYESDVVLAVKNENIKCQSEGEILNTLNGFFDAAVNTIVTNSQHAADILLTYRLRREVISAVEV